ncbi:inositol monophosphatase [Terasakiella sp. A23]|uniref:inositol monophosphatase family protein n=1 Tax=Terasakiella sp. FCG-A23 TaxID=3080561 RepID=UPI002953CDD5|nr:inositol monophosphatase [Terasakiella sp. A23]MDV7338595.1 inositol monophosphatase [Terasakiella sp. A23]
MKIDVDHITRIIAEVADEEIMPRFQKLNSGDIMEKSPGDLVTTADLEAETKLIARLQDALPGSLVVGEEGVSENKSVLDALESDNPVWIIDPVDGTRNFANGESVFGTMVALSLSGEIIAGWIHDPARSRTAVAEKGAGAVLSGKKLQVRDITAFERMTVALSFSHRQWIEQRAIDGLGPVPHMARRYGSVAHDYISLACGEFHCAQYRRLNPWDHAPGVLIHREAGGYDQMIAAKEPYKAQIYAEDCLLLTPNKEIWEQARAFLNPGSDSYHV